MRWQRDLDAALQQSADTGKPVFVLFQEIPGCSGCQTFGRDVLSNPLLVEAIEDEFIPVLVYNNRSGGTDEKLLKRFGEPAWNFQVVRFLDAQARDIISRKDHVWDLGVMASRMMEALEVAGRTAPKYLEALAAENDTQHQAVSAFAMSCFWTGETQLGQIDGVVSTEAGWIEGREVTRVVYRKDRLTLEELARRADRANCAQKVFAPGADAKSLSGFSTGSLDSGYRKARPADQKKQVERWHALRKLPGLTVMQLTKLNALAASNRAQALEWLSPRQRQALHRAEQDTQGHTQP